MPGEEVHFGIGQLHDIAKPGLDIAVKDRVLLLVIVDHVALDDAEVDALQEQHVEEVLAAAAPENWQHSHAVTLQIVQDVLHVLREFRIGSLRLRAHYCDGILV